MINVLQSNLRPSLSESHHHASNPDRINHSIDPSKGSPDVLISLLLQILRAIVNRARQSRSCYMGQLLCPGRVPPSKARPLQSRGSLFLQSRSWMDRSLFEAVFLSASLSLVHLSAKNIPSSVNTALQDPRFGRLTAFFLTMTLEYQ